MSSNKHFKVTMTLSIIIITIAVIATLSMLFLFGYDARDAGQNNTLAVSLLSSLGGMMILIITASCMHIALILNWSIFGICRLVRYFKRNKACLPCDTVNPTPYANLLTRYSIYTMITGGITSFIAIPLFIMIFNQEKASSEIEKVFLLFASIGGIASIIALVICILITFASLVALAWIIYGIWWSFYKLTNKEENSFEEPYDC